MSTRWEGHGSSVPCARGVSEEDGGARRAEKACWLCRRRRWTWMAVARGQRCTGGAGAEQGGASVARARARGSERARGLWRGGEAVQERRACGSGGASREWRRRSGVRARVRAAVSREGRRTVSETDAWARGRIKRKTDRAGPPTLSTGRSDGSKKKHRSNHRSNVDRI